ncbi:MAG: hypothetical protein ACXADA_20490 [Candidatus Hodarchaeales archaeon]|jgi:hypothetical protein
MTITDEPIDSPTKTSCENILLAFLFQPPINVSELKKHYPSHDVHGTCLDLCQVRILTSKIKGRDIIFSLEPFTTVFVRFLKESTRFFIKKNIAKNRKERKSLSFLFERGLVLRGRFKGHDVLYLNSLYFLEVDPFFDIISRTLTLMNTSPVIDKKRSVRQFSEKDLEILDIDFRDVDHATIIICLEGSDLRVLSRDTRHDTSSFFEITIELDGRYEIPPPVEKILGTVDLSLEVKLEQSGIFLVKGDEFQPETSSKHDLVEKISEESVVAFFLQQKDSRMYLRSLRRIFSLELDKIITELCFKRVLAFRKGNNFPATTFYCLRTEIKMLAMFMKRYFRLFKSRNSRDREFLIILMDRGLVLQGFIRQGYRHNVVYYLNAPRIIKKYVLFDTLSRAFDYSGDSFLSANVSYSTGQFTNEQIRTIGILDTSRPKFIIRADNLEILPSFPDGYKWGKHSYFEIAISHGKFELSVPVARVSGVEEKSLEVIERPGKGFFLEVRQISIEKEKNATFTSDHSEDGQDKVKMNQDLLIEENRANEESKSVTILEKLEKLFCESSSGKTDQQFVNADFFWNMLDDKIQRTCATPALLKRIKHITKGKLIYYSSTLYHSILQLNRELIDRLFHLSFRGSSNSSIEEIILLLGYVLRKKIYVDGSIELLHVDKEKRTIILSDNEEIINVNSNRFNGEIFLISDDYVNISPKNIHKKNYPRSIYTIFDEIISVNSSLKRKLLETSIFDKKLNRQISKISIYYLGSKIPENEVILQRIAIDIKVLDLIEEATKSISARQIKRVLKSAEKLSKRYEAKFNDYKNLSNKQKLLKCLKTINNFKFVSDKTIQNFTSKQMQICPSKASINQILFTKSILDYQIERYMHMYKPISEIYYKLIMNLSEKLVLMNNKTNQMTDVNVEDTDQNWKKLAKILDEFDQSLDMYLEDNGEKLLKPSLILHKLRKERILGTIYYEWLSGVIDDKKDQKSVIKYVVVNWLKAEIVFDNNSKTIDPRTGLREIAKKLHQFFQISSEDEKFGKTLVINNIIGKNDAAKAIFVSERIAGYEISRIHSKYGGENTWTRIIKFLARKGDKNNKNLRDFSKALSLNYTSTGLSNRRISCSDILSDKEMMEAKLVLGIKKQGEYYQNISRYESIDRKDKDSDFHIINRAIKTVKDLMLGFLYSLKNNGSGGMAGYSLRVINLENENTVKQVLEPFIKILKFDEKERDYFLQDEDMQELTDIISCYFDEKMDKFDKTTPFDDLIAKIIQDLSSYSIIELRRNTKIQKKLLNLACDVFSLSNKLN